MKNFLHLLAIIMVWLLLPYTSSGQVYDPKVQHSEANGLVTFTTSDCGYKPATLYILGDGHYCQVNEPKHLFPASGSGYLNDVFFVERYRDDEATKVCDTVTWVGSGSSYQNGTIEMDDDIEVHYSWYPAPGNSWYYIVNFTHQCSDSLISGKVTVHFDQEVVIDTNVIYDQFNNWVYDREIKTSTLSGYSTLVEWKFDSLNHDEVRTLYIKGNLPSSVDTGIALKHYATLSTTACGGYNSSSSGNIYSSKYPHDPNIVTVQPTKIQSMNPSPQGLSYRIKFQNDGDTVAQNVKLYCYLPPEIDMLSLVMGQASAPYTYSILPSGILEIDFTQINLPGSNQQQPNMYCYSQTVGYIDFNVCTFPNLRNCTNIDLYADIIFDTQPPIPTNWASVQACAEFPYSVCLPSPVTGTQEPSSKIGVSPNPSTNFITIHAWDRTFDPYMDLRILSLNGVEQEIVGSHIHPNADNIQISVGHLKTGIYLLLLPTALGKVVPLKFYKK